MSEFLSAAASTMKVPEALVKRSAEARAKATGSSVDDVLQAWAGGAAAPVTAAPEPAPTPEPEVASPEPGPAEAPAPVPAVSQPAAAPATAAASVAVAVAEEESEPVDPVPVRERTRVGGRVGAGIGVLAALFVMVFSAQWLLARTGSIQTEAGDISFTLTVASGSFILGSALLGLAVGLAIAALVRAITGWRSPGMRLVSSSSSTLVIGAVAGLLTGLVVAAVVVGAGTADELDEALTVIPVIPALLWTLLGWIGGGWLVGAVTQALGVPDGLAAPEFEAGETVRGRLGAAFSIPVVAAFAILVLVLPAAWVFIQFPGWAPLIAIFISGGIIAFAGMSAARPGMRITTGEFLAAASGVGVVVLIIVAVLTTQGAGH